MTQFVQVLAPGQTLNEKGEVVIAKLPMPPSFPYLEKLAREKSYTQLPLTQWKPVVAKA